MKIQLQRRLQLNARSILLGSFLLLAGLTQPVLAAYPDKPIKVLVGYAPGSSTDIIGRIIAQDLSMALQRQQILMMQYVIALVFAMPRLDQ